MDTTPNWTSPPNGFSHIIFDRTSDDGRQRRFYFLAWQPSLVDPGAVIRIWGRKGGHQRHLSPTPFPSLDDAWPLLRSIIKTRLRHGYTIVYPENLVR